ncbi:signal peptidase I [Roseimaritima ulvae]|nr:signal peptidase I [Roseimaritima ulvae]
MAKNSTPRGPAAVKKNAPADAKQKRERSPALAGHRETVESICVAIILALLFRSFVAEAFVIPTGSMAPTLMGAHKDLFCDACGYNFRVGASIEHKEVQGFRPGRPSYLDVVGGRCPNCRKLNALNLASDANHATFNGDRILVSKFAYAIQEPQRWDVIVFKYPGNPKQNYIKRLVGLPEETLRIWHGDVYTRSDDEDEYAIARKPDHKVMPMAHLVYDSNFPAADLMAANYPSRLQPWQADATKPPTDSWQVKTEPVGLVATVQAGDSPQWLRYFHNLPSDEERQRIAEGQSMESVDPYRSRAITDFYAYDSYFTTNRANVRNRNGTSVSYQDGQLPRPLYDNELEYGAFHWVGDLTFSADLETDSAASETVLEIIEAGIRYRCTIDLASGQATLSISGDQAEAFDGGQTTLTAATDVRAGQQYALRFSNVDNQLRLWVDGDSVSFDATPTFDPQSFATDHQDRPHYRVGEPLDAAPVGIAVAGGAATVQNFQLHRDQYYIAATAGIPMLDYSFSPQVIKRTLHNPDQWDSATFWKMRREIEFDLEADQFFPMGDNSPESKDARSWVDSRFPPVPDKDAYKYARYNYVPRDLLVGKALLVFWPHSWNRPVPFTPNVKRMKLIR